MKAIIKEKTNLAKLLLKDGHHLDLRCGGAGFCKRCSVKLLRGIWSVEDKIVNAPCTALSCKTYLVSDEGEVEFNELESEGNISVSWYAEDLLAREEAVVAVDIGTTSIVAGKIYNGKILKKVACFNSQIQYGDNVVSRIESAKTELQALQSSVINSIKSLLVQFDMSDVKRIAVAGNTVMSCLFHGVDPATIGYVPFEVPQRIFPVRTDLLFDLPVLTVPCIAAYVGGDLTAGLYEIELAEGEMLVDVGTNCEIIFNAGDHGYICTAAAAGPAFEGAGLNHGCRANSGAIDHYYGNGKFSTISDEKAIGICGSAYIDFLAKEYECDNLNMCGRFENGETSFHLTSDIFIDEKDIEQILKAKAAVYSAIMTIEEFYKIKAKKIYLAGGFAQFLDLENAKKINMLPDREYQIIGNSSFAGAVHLAISPEISEKLEQLIDLPKEKILNQFPNFEDNYIDGLLL